MGQFLSKKTKEQTNNRNESSREDRTEGAREVEENSDVKRQPHFSAPLQPATPLQPTDPGAEQESGRYATGARHKPDEDMGVDEIAHQTTVAGEEASKDTTLQRQERTGKACAAAPQERRKANKGRTASSKKKTKAQKIGHNEDRQASGTQNSGKTGKNNKSQLWKMSWKKLKCPFKKWISSGCYKPNKGTNDDAIPQQTTGTRRKFFKSNKKSQKQRSVSKTRATPPEERQNEFTDREIHMNCAEKKQPKNSSKPVHTPKNPPEPLKTSLQSDNPPNLKEPDQSQDSPGKQKELINETTYKNEYNIQGCKSIHIGDNVQVHVHYDFPQCNGNLKTATSHGPGHEDDKPVRESCTCSHEGKPPTFKAKISLFSYFSKVRQHLLDYFYLPWINEVIEMDTMHNERSRELQAL